VIDIQKKSLWKHFLKTTFDFESALLFCHQIGRRLIKRPCCQRTSLVLFYLSGPGAEFKIGVKKPFEAHAWVSIMGQTYSDPVSTLDYSEIVSYSRQ
jgi:hypothetical protein